MVMRLFGLKITVEKDIPYILINEGGGFISVHIEYEVAKKHFLRRLKGDYLTVLSKFRESVKTYFGYHLSLSTSVNYTKRFFMEGER